MFSVAAPELWNELLSLIIKSFLKATSFWFFHQIGFSVHLYCIWDGQFSLIFQSILLFISIYLLLFSCFIVYFVFSPLFLIF